MRKANQEAERRVLEAESMGRQAVRDERALWARRLDDAREEGRRVMEVLHRENSALRLTLQEIETKVLHSFVGRQSVYASPFGWTIDSSLLAPTP